MITASTSDCETPVTVAESLIQRITPVSTVPDPSVAISESTPR